MKRIWQLALLCLLVFALFSLPSTACLPFSSQGVLRLWDSGPITLDPAISADMSSHTYVMHIFSGLVRLDHELNIVPDIAESWETSPDGKTYTFHLRQGVKFHSGREVKAADFKYSWERACHPDTGSGTAATYLGDIVGVKDMLAGEAEEISGVEVFDDYTLRVTIDAPKAYFLNKLAYPTAFVVDRANAESGEDWWREPDGTGPFKLKEWQAGERLILERSQIYYGEPAKLEQVVYLLSGMPMTLYETGQIDVVSVYLPYIDRASDETGPFYSELAVTPELSLYYIGFNTAQPPFDDVNVRRAFCHAVDKEHIAKVILRDMISEAGGILPPGMPGYNEALEGLDYDVEKAKELIADSKYGDASNLPPITLTVNGYGNSIPSYLGAIIQEWQQNLGVEISVRQLESENFLYNLKQEKDEMFVMGWIADYPDPHNFLDVLFYTGSEVNLSEYSNSTLDALLDQAAIEQDEALRLAMYQQAEQLVVDDAPCLPLFHGANYILVEPYIKGYELSPLGIPDLRRVYIDKN
ncbi:MAG: peptide ABC transporter substrate-binding protein [Dehalococcoidia bacterium]|nr:peptide ABC transporter substrate-binding protein [Dehalococcoidia bacterium]RLC64898.1 MAG: peptide ABC transporter substrate-binding protein [Chloroflexota bacterium]